MYSSETGVRGGSLAVGDDATDACECASLDILGGVCVGPGESYPPPPPFLCGAIAHQSQIGILCNVVSYITAVGEFRQGLHATHFVMRLCSMYYATTGLRSRYCATSLSCRRGEGLCCHNHARSYLSIGEF